MKAEIIAVGSELLSPFRVDTNSLFLTRSLEESGIQVTAKSVIGDVMADLVRAFKNAFERADIIICSGGLGPTVDDLTKEALSKFTGVPLEFHEEILEWIRQRFASFGAKMPEINRQQAMIPAGAKILPNPNGTAPGVFLETQGKQVFLLPGPPPELEPMWREHALPLLAKGKSFQRKIFRVAMLGESKVDEMLQPVSRSLHDVQYTILASPSEIEIHLLAPEDAAPELVNAAAEVRIILGKHIYSEEYESLEEAVGKLLKKLGKTIALAESCTGGLLGHRLTQLPGSSTYLNRGAIVYSNEAKTEMLGVPPELIGEHGAVSQPVAKA